MSRPGTEAQIRSQADPAPSAARYYFKKVSDEFDCGVVFEEEREDEAVLPLYEGKIIGKVEKID